MGASIVSQRYLHRLPARSPASERRARPRAHGLIRPGAAVAVLALLATSGLAALALERMAASLRGDLPTGWPANGCLDASVIQVSSRQIVTGHGRLCLADSRMHGTLDLEHLQPTARYAEWIAYFESPSLCSAGALKYQIYNFNQPCGLIDLEGPQAHGVAHHVAESTADAQGDLHMEGLISEIDMRPHAQAWLVAARPGWSPTEDATNRIAQDDTHEAVGRAQFDLP